MIENKVVNIYYNVFMIEIKYYCFIYTFLK